MVKSRTKELIKMFCISILIALAAAGALTCIFLDQEQPVELPPPVSNTGDKQPADIPDYPGDAATMTQEPASAPGKPAAISAGITPMPTITPQVTPTYWNDTRAAPDGYPSGIGSACCAGGRVTCTPTPASVPAPATTICIPFGKDDSPCQGY